MNCGHNSALLFQARTQTLKRLDSSCPPIGLAPNENCELASAELAPGDVLVFYTDGVTEAENLLAEEFGMERLSAILQRGSSLSAKGLMDDIFNSAANFSKDVGFGDDVTILVVEVPVQRNWLAHVQLRNRNKPGDRGSLEPFQTTRSDLVLLVWECRSTPLSEYWHPVHRAGLLRLT